jgi:hypothetical protein
VRHVTLVQRVERIIFSNVCEVFQGFF